MDFDGNLIQIAAQLILAYRGYALVSLVLLVVAYKSIKYVRSPKNVETFQFNEEQAELASLPPLDRPPVSLSRMNAFAFEMLIEDILNAQGHQAIRLGGNQPDGGIDLIIDRENSVPMAVQCKKYWEEPIGLPRMREFLGAMADGGYSEGLYVTLRGYTPQAKDFAQKHQIQLWDEATLNDLLTQYFDQLPRITKILLHAGNPHCPSCKGLMIPRKTKNGAFKGQYFWGCRIYTCKGLRHIHGQ